MVLANATNFYRKSGKGSETILADRIQSEIAQGRILCVDDNLLELNAFSGRFWSCRATQLFRFVTPYRHCIAIVSTFDLAILDFDMPGMNGKISGVYLGQDTSVTIQHESLPWVRKSNMLKTPMTASLVRTSGSHTDAQMKAMGQIYQSLQQQASILSYVEVLQALAIFCAPMVPFGALDEASAQRRHGGRPLITHVSPPETNKCASSQTFP